MQRTTLQDRLSEWVDEVREQTETMPPGPEQDALFKKIAQADQDQNLTIGSARRSFNRGNDSWARCFALSATFSPIDDVVGSLPARLGISELLSQL